jgi:hypothetical protein
MSKTPMVSIEYLFLIYFHRVFSCSSTTVTKSAHQICIAGLRSPGKEHNEPQGCGCNGGAAATLGLMDALLGRLAFSTPCGNTLPCWKENAAIGFSWTTWSCCWLGLWQWPPSHGWLILTLSELMLCHYQCCTILFSVAKPSPVTIF